MRGIRGFGVALILCAAAVVLQAEETRTWTSSQGGFKIDATLVAIKNDDTAVLKRADGTVIEVSLDKLSEADQKFAREHKPAPVAAAVPREATEKEVALLLASVEREANQCRTAANAVTVYHVFLADPTLPMAVRAQAEERLKHWESLGEKDFVRLGREWVPRADAVAASKEATSLITQAIEFLRLNNDQLAKDALERASKVDPNATQADFLMGLVYCLIAKNPTEAAKHFNECLKREPDNVSALNNLALAEIRMGQYSNAVTHWRAAVRSAPRAPELTQNIGRLLDQVGKRKIQIPPTALSNLGQVYGRMVADGVPSSDSRMGFLFMSPIVRHQNGEEAADVPVDNIEADGMITGGGSGFVVAPHLILTNRHVVEDAGGFVVTIPQDGKKPDLHVAKLVATCPTADLALLRCDELEAPAVLLQPTFPQRATDILLLGYPEFTEIGISIKATRGSIVSLPSRATRDCCLYDATTNPGNSGGPVCDATGRVVAVHCAGYNFGGKLGAGVPVSAAIPFLQQHIPELTPALQPDGKLEWTAVDEAINPSVVLILRKESTKRDVGLEGRSQGNLWEDRSCLACRGGGSLPCPNGGCVLGKVTTTERVVVGSIPATGAKAYGNRKVKSTCPTCHGKGSVDCRACTNGIDPSLHYSYGSSGVIVRPVK